MVFTARRIRAAIAACALMGSAAALPLAASATSGSSSAAISATVSNNCVFGTSSLSFGSYDALAANNTSDLTGTGTVNVSCTSGDLYTITADTGANGANAASGFTRAMKYTTGGGTPTSYYLSYELYIDGGLSNVWNSTNTLGATGSGASQALSFYGKVGHGQTGVPAASYSDTVNLSITF